MYVNSGASKNLLLGTARFSSSNYDNHDINEIPKEGYSWSKHRAQHEKQKAITKHYKQY